MTDNISKPSKKPPPRYKRAPGGEKLLDPWLKAASPALRNAARLAVESLLAVEPQRLRARRESAQRALEANVEALVANLAYWGLASPANEEGNRPSVVVPLHKGGKPGRYDMRLSDKMSDVVSSLAKAGWLILRKSRPGRRGAASTVRIGPALLDALCGQKVTFRDFKHVAGGETLILTTKKAGYRNKLKDDGSWEGVYDHKQTALVDYSETTRTRQLREQLEAINQWLDAADIRLTKSGPDVDTGKRRLRRHFNLKPGVDPKNFKFNSGGRLFGGWWMDLNSAQRKHVRIDGEVIADLDYSSMFVRLALHQAGREVDPAFDPYEIPGVSKAYREPVKKIVSALLFAESLRTKYPRKMEGIEGLKAVMKFPELRKRIFAHVPGAENIFERGLGFGLFYLESEVLLACLERMRERGIVALPMHDGLMVPAPRAPEAMEIMRLASTAVLGVELPVKRKM